MAHDEANYKIVLFGGQDSFNKKLGDTWTWQQEKGRVKSDLEGPKARINATMTYADQL